MSAHCAVHEMPSVWRRKRDGNQKTREEAKEREREKKSRTKDREIKSDRDLGRGEREMENIGNQLMHKTQCLLYTLCYANYVLKQQQANTKKKETNPKKIVLKKCIVQCCSNME